MQPAGGVGGTIAGSGGIVTTSGGAGGATGAGGTPPSPCSEADPNCFLTLSTTPSACSAGWICTIGLDGIGRISQPTGASDYLCGCFDQSGNKLNCAAGTSCPAR
jgi:hypothetical protein